MDSLEPSNFTDPTTAADLTTEDMAAELERLTTFEPSGTYVQPAMAVEELMQHLEPSGWAEPAAGATGGTEDDFTPAPKTCPHCHLFYKVEPGWEIEQQGQGWKAELVLWGRCSNCGGYMERTERHG